MHASIAPMGYCSSKPSKSSEDIAFSVLVVSHGTLYIALDLPCICFELYFFLVAIYIYLQHAIENDFEPYELRVDVEENLQDLRSY